MKVTFGRANLRSVKMISGTFYGLNPLMDVLLYLSPSLCPLIVINMVDEAKSAYGQLWHVM